MPKRLNHSQLLEALRSYLVQAGPVSAQQACRHLQISQPVFSRLIQKAKKTNAVLVFGKASATQYVARRNMGEVGSHIPLYEVDEKGQPIHLATLYPTEPRGFYFELKRPGLLNLHDVCSPA